MITLWWQFQWCPCVCASKFDSSTSLILEVPNVPAEPRWSTPRREHIFCAEDPSGASNTFAMSYLVTPIEQTYESFVLRVLSELLVEGPSAPFYQALIESGLAQAFSPVTGKFLYCFFHLFTFPIHGYL